jgi:hypothetical protein
LAEGLWGDAKKAGSFGSVPDRPLHRFLDQSTANVRQIIVQDKPLLRFRQRVKPGSGQDFIK